MYHYLGAGLPNVYLKNGYELVDSPYGKGVVIHDLERLHDALGEAIVCSQGPLVGYEFKFLRTELELSQETLAGLLGCSEQSVARWEKGKSKKVDALAERLLRHLYQESKMGKKKLEPLLRRLQDFDGTPHAPRKFVARERAENWTAKLEAVA